MEIALFFVSIFCMYSSIMAWVFYKENKRLQSKNDELVEKLDVKLKDKQTIEFDGIWKQIFDTDPLKEQSVLYERLITELNTKVKCLEVYFDLVYKTETDGHIFRSYYEKEPNENNSGGYTKKFYIVNKDDVKLTEEPFEKTSFKVKGVKKSDELKSVAASVAVKKGIEVLRNVLSQLEEG